MPDEIQGGHFTHARVVEGRNSIQPALSSASQRPSPGSGSRDAEPGEAWPCPGALSTLLPAAEKTAPAFKSVC